MSKLHKLEGGSVVCEMLSTSIEPSCLLRPKTFNFKRRQFDGKTNSDEQVAKSLVTLTTKLGVAGSNPAQGI